MNLPVNSISFPNEQFKENHPLEMMKHYRSFEMICREHEFLEYFLAKAVKMMWCITLQLRCGGCFT